RMRIGMIIRRNMRKSIQEWPACSPSSPLGVACSKRRALLGRTLLDDGAPPARAVPQLEQKCASTASSRPQRAQNRDSDADIRPLAAWSVHLSEMTNVSNGGSAPRFVGLPTDGPGPPTPRGAHR